MSLDLEQRGQANKKTAGASMCSSRFDTAFAADINPGSMKGKGCKLAHWIDQGIDNPTIRHVHCGTPVKTSCFFSSFQKFHHGRAPI
ncbi:hypothetical protein [uncultured Cohaesibacter sp.]|uniref:hypothetical protein n=1 Tax=uncultured Cohaesibacter sp. TaxID=1002546 RepID=UPI00292DB70B|nr:hypothetical protein [uncultured Cohaesibacter sp.]